MIIMLDFMNRQLTLHACRQASHQTHLHT